MVQFKIIYCGTFDYRYPDARNRPWQTNNMFKMTMCCVKIKCPQCKQSADLSGDFSTVSCKHCGVEMSYGEYVKYVAHNDATYSDILGDYAGNTMGQSSGSLDDWD